MTLLCTKKNDGYLNTKTLHLHHTINYKLFEDNIAKLTGVDAAILSNRIKYWISKCDKPINGQKGLWIYNSLPEWHKQFNYCSMYKPKKTIKYLEDLNLIKSVKNNAEKVEPY